MEYKAQESVKGIKLIGDRVIIKLDPKEETTKAGLYLPTHLEEDARVKNADGSAVWGEVVATGESTEFLKVGDRVLAGGRAVPISFEDSEDDYIIMVESGLTIFRRNSTF